MVALLSQNTQDPSKRISHPCLVLRWKTVTKQKYLEIVPLRICVTLCKLSNFVHL